jgi:hypothetical protein
MANGESREGPRRETTGEANNWTVFVRHSGQYSQMRVKVRCHRDISLHFRCPGDI